MTRGNDAFVPQARSLSGLLSELASSTGGRVAVRHRDGTCTYGDLERRSWSVAEKLIESGVVPGDRVALLCTNRIEWVETYFGAAYAGATVHAINTWVTGAELGDLLEDSDPTVLVLLAAHGKNRYLDDLRSLVPEAWAAEPGRWQSSRYPRLREIVVVAGDPTAGMRGYEEWVGPSDAEDPGQSASHMDPAAAPDRTGVVLYTSGSSARPKAVPLLDGAMIENGFNIGERMGLTVEDRVWLGSPLFWSYGCANALMATFTHAATLVLQEQFAAGQAIELIDQAECTAAYLLPTMIRALIEAPEFDERRLRSLRTGLTIGSSDDLRSAVQTLGIRQICNVYGSTETYGNCCVTPHDAPLERRLESQGPPLPGVTVRIVDTANQSVLGAGQVGEIQTRGFLTPGYVGDSADPAIFTDDGFYRSGDLGFLDSDGWLRFTSRATEMIKTSGINVAPAEVEQCLMTHPAVEEVAVVGVPDLRRDEAVVAYVVARAGVAPTADELIDHCRQRIASYKVPTRVELVTGLPRTGTGKLSRRELRNRAMHGTDV